MKEIEKKYGIKLFENIIQIHYNIGIKKHIIIMKKCNKKIILIICGNEQIRDISS